MNDHMIEMSETTRSTSLNFISVKIGYEMHKIAVQHDLSFAPRKTDIIEQFMIDRQVSFENASEALKSDLRHKGCRYLHAVIASSGIGKTTFLKNLSQYFQHKDDSTIALHVSFARSRPYDAFPIITFSACVLESFYFETKNDTILLEINQMLHKLFSEFSLNISSVSATTFSIILNAIFIERQVQHGTGFVLLIDGLSETDLTISGSSRMTSALLLQLCLDMMDELDNFYLIVAERKHFILDDIRASGRVIEYIPLPLLSFESSVKFIESFASSTFSKSAINHLAVASVGYPYILTIFRDIFNHTIDKYLLTPAFILQQCSTLLRDSGNWILSSSELVIALNKNTIMKTDAIKKQQFVNGIACGKFLLSFESDTFLHFTVSPIVLRLSILQLEPDGNFTSEMISVLRNLLKISGFDTFDIHSDNSSVDGSINVKEQGNFKLFHFNMEILKRQLISNKLTANKFITPTVVFGSPLLSCQLYGCDVFAKKGEISTQIFSQQSFQNPTFRPKIIVSNGTSDYCFPQFDQIPNILNHLKLDSHASRKQLLEKWVSVLLFVAPRNSTVYDFMTIVQGMSDFVISGPIAQVFKMSTNCSDILSDVLKYYEAVMHLPWEWLGLKTKCVVVVFVYFVDSPHKTVRQHIRKVLKDSTLQNVIVLTKSDLRWMYGALYHVCRYLCANKKD